ncbi:acyl carrier protein [Clostridium sp. LP20]|uniref:acyl carrier protein n=1 Tax=Clostridium sp. LP20 TaxID=3418665 RepID=UPI003EE55C53
MLEKLKTILSEELNLEKESIKVETLIYDELGVDSLSLFSIMETVEKEFKITIPDDIEIVTVGDMIDVIKELKN